MKNNAYEFLSRYHQTSDEIDIVKSITFLRQEAGDALRGKKCSLEMIPSYLTAEFDVIKNKKNIVIDAGGTNFRSGIAYFDDDNNCVLSDISRTVMPGVDHEIGKEEFYDKIAYNVKDLVNKGDNIGFCFSYSVNMNKDIDGTANPFSKEVRAPEVVGTLVGQSTLNALKKYDAKPRKIAILNDTVATLLGGMGCNLNKNYSSYIGYIYGTGTNVSYIEKNVNITKVGGLDRKGCMVINTECGGFDKFPRGEFDEHVNATSVNPGEQSAEKMTSGKYLAEVIFCALEKAKEEGLIDVDLTDHNLFSTANISEFLHQHGENCALSSVIGAKDMEFVTELSLYLIDRAAKIGAIMNSAFILQCGEGRDKSRPIALVAEGTTFYKLYSYKEKFEQYLHKILDNKGIYFEIVSGNELNLVGTAMAAMAL